MEYDSAASSLSPGSCVLAFSSPKRFEWVKMNLDSGAAVNTCPSNFAPYRVGDRRFYRTASGECILDVGAWQFSCYEENGLCRSVKGRLSGAHKVFCSAGEIACNGHQNFYLGSGDGFVIPVHSKIGQEMRIHFERLVSWYGRIQLSAVYIEDNIFNFQLSKEVMSTETNVVNNSQHRGNECGSALRSQVQ